MISFALHFCFLLLPLHSFRLNILNTGVSLCRFWSEESNSKTGWALRVDGNQEGKKQTYKAQLFMQLPEITVSVTYSNLQESTS